MTYNTVKNTEIKQFLLNFLMPSVLQAVCEKSQISSTKIPSIFSLLI